MMYCRALRMYGASLGNLSATVVGECTSFVSTLCPTVPLRHNTNNCMPLVCTSDVLLVK